MAPAMLDGLPDSPLWVVGDRGFWSDALRAQVWDMGTRPAIPPRRNEAPVRCPDSIHVRRKRGGAAAGQAEGSGCDAD